MYAYEAPPVLWCHECILVSFLSQVRYVPCSGRLRTANTNRCLPLLLPSRRLSSWLMRHIYFPCLRDWNRDTCFVSISFSPLFNIQESPNILHSNKLSWPIGTARNVFVQSSGQGISFRSRIGYTPPFGETPLSQESKVLWNLNPST